MYTCTESFKTTLFTGDVPQRIVVEKDSLWFLDKKLADDRVMLCNNKIELNIARKILEDKFTRWG